MKAIRAPPWSPPALRGSLRARCLSPWWSPLARSGPVAAGLGGRIGLWVRAGQPPAPSPKFRCRRSCGPRGGAGAAPGQRRYGPPARGAGAAGAARRSPGIWTGQYRMCPAVWNAPAWTRRRIRAPAGPPQTTSPDRHVEMSGNGRRAAGGPDGCGVPNRRGLAATNAFGMDRRG